MPNTNPQTVYFVSRFERDDQGWIPLIATEDEPGYTRKDWRWNCTFEEAQILCDSKNKAMGISKRVAMIIQVSTLKEIPKNAQTTPYFWECNCDENYIYKRSDDQYCLECEANHIDQPDARVSEIPFEMTIKGGA